MRTTSAAAFSTATLTAVAISLTASAGNWSSFDASRINYEAGTLDGTVHSTLRSIIEDNGGTIVDPAPLLTADYLAGVDVFYTSLLNVETGALSSDEQTVLHDWIAAGGTLIVTADIFPFRAYDSFTSFYGVTNYFDQGVNGSGQPVAQHPITDDVASYRYHTNSTFIYGADAMLLGDDVDGFDFMIVMEPDTGFKAGGRILVIGDHNMFTNTYINGEDNSQLVANFVQWANQASDDKCPADLDDDGAVGTGDLIVLLGAWGTDPGGPPDLDGDGNVGTSDLIELLGNWGPCE